MSRTLTTVLHLLVEALAGTGKTTTLEWCLRQKLPRGITPSPEQADIIAAAKDIFFPGSRGKKRTIAVQAFNKSISLEMESRIGDIAEVRTCNAFGHRAWSDYIGVKRLDVRSYKSSMIFRDLPAISSLPYKDRIRLESPVSDIIDLLKSNYRPGDYFAVEEYATYERCEQIARTFGIEFDSDIHQYVVDVLNISVNDEQWHKIIDYNDQLFLPLWFDIPLPKFDILGIDEVQDLNAAKQEIASRMGEQLFPIGDSHQAIYAFAGADSRSIASLSEIMGIADGNVHVLPLTETRRCSRTVVQEANRYVPDLRAHESNRIGEVGYVEESDFITTLESHIPSKEHTRMVISTTNAPLTKLAFSLIAKEVRCFIQGRDLGASLKRRITETGERDLSRAIDKADSNFEKKIIRLSRVPFPSDDKIQAVRDQQHCLHTITDKCTTIDQFNKKVDELFKEYGSPTDIRLTTAHKSKGLEARHVNIVNPHRLGVPFSKDPTPIEVEQARNLAYVAITRSEDTLHYVSPASNSEFSD